MPLATRYPPALCKINTCIKEVVNTFKPGNAVSLSLVFHAIISQSPRAHSCPLTFVMYQEFARQSKNWMVDLVLKSFWNLASVAMMGSVCLGWCAYPGHDQNIPPGSDTRAQLLPLTFSNRGNYIVSFSSYLLSDLSFFNVGNRSSNFGN